MTIKRGVFEKDYFVQEPEEDYAQPVEVVSDEKGYLSKITEVEGESEDTFDHIAQI